MQFIEAPLQVQQRNKIPQLISDNCKALGQVSSGNSNSNVTQTPHNAAGHQDPYFILIYIYFFIPFILLCG